MSEHADARSGADADAQTDAGADAGPHGTTGTTTGSRTGGRTGGRAPARADDGTGTDVTGRDGTGTGPDGAHDARAVPPGKGRVGRFWSVRRVPAGILALLLLAGSGALLYDVVAVRLGRRALRARRVLADQLATRPLDDTWVLVGAGVATALGLWLLLLALTPGLRAVLPMRRTHTEVRAGIDRQAAAMVLRDRITEVSGVQSARVKVRRRKARVRAVSHFRPLDDVRADVDAVLAEAGDGLGLSRPLGSRVRVTRPGRKG